MSYEPRLQKIYRDEVCSALMEEFGIKNVMAVPNLHKIVVNVGCGEGAKDPKILEEATEQLQQITGQTPTIRKARKSIANFKLRDGMPIGAAVTLRRRRMWDFYDRLVNLALPRVRDFRGLSPKSFDGRGNYTFGVRDQLIFPEVNYAKVKRALGMNITVVTSATNDAHARSLLSRLGMPFTH